MQRTLRLIENAFSWRLSRFHNWNPSEPVAVMAVLWAKKKMLCKGIAGMQSLNWEPEQQLWRDLAQIKPPVAFGSDVYLLLGHRYTDFLPDFLQNIKGRGMPNIFTCLIFHRWKHTVVKYLEIWTMCLSKQKAHYCNWNPSVKTVSLTSNLLLNFFFFLFFLAPPSGPTSEVVLHHPVHVMRPRSDFILKTTSASSHVVSYDNPI